MARRWRWRWPDPKRLLLRSTSTSYFSSFPGNLSSKSFVKLQKIVPHRRSGIRPDPHETLRDDESVRESASSIFSLEDADEEILRPNLQFRPGPPRARPFESFLETFLPSRPNASQPTGPRFAGVTENTKTTNTREKSSEISDLLRQLFEGGPGDLESLLKSKDETKKRRVRNQWEPLHFAAQKGSASLCKALLERGANVNSREDDNWTPVIFAAQNGHLEACRVFLDYKADVNAVGDSQRTALFQASQSGHAEVVKLLVTGGADIHLTLEDGTTPLFMAAYVYCIKDRLGCLDVVSHLLKAGGDPNAGDTQNLSPLFIASIYNKLDMVELLLAHGANPNRCNLRGKRCLGGASSETNPGIVRLLLQYGADIHAKDDTHWTALHLATQHDKPATLEVVKILVSAGVGINAQVDRGATALYLSVQSKRPDVAEFLIQAGANLDLATNYGMNPLLRAVADSSLDTVNLLLENGAKTDIIDTEGLTLAHFAAIQEDPAVARRIFDTGVDLDLVSTDEHRIRPIHLACQNDNEDIAIAFLEYGVKP